MLVITQYVGEEFLVGDTLVALLAREGNAIKLGFSGPAAIERDERIARRLRAQGWERQGKLWVREGNLATTARALGLDDSAGS